MDGDNSTDVTLMSPTDHLRGHHQRPVRLMMANAEGHPRIVGSTVVIHVDTEHLFYRRGAGPEEMKGWFQARCGVSTTKKHTTTEVASDH